MKLRALAPALALALAATAFAAAPANAYKGEVSLVEVLGADGVDLDHNWNDFDIVEAAAFAVLAEKPTSAVGVLADGSVKLTAFMPTDRAFRRLVHDLTGKWLERGEHLRHGRHSRCRHHRGGPALPRRSRSPRYVQAGQEGRRRQAHHRCRDRPSRSTSATAASSSSMPTRTTSTPASRAACATSTPATSRSPTESTGCFARSISNPSRTTPRRN